MVTLVNGPKGKALITKDEKSGKFVIEFHSFVSFALMLPKLVVSENEANEIAAEFCKMGKLQ
ncbi:hypothetical protein D3C80_129040 [compost metagenome]